MKLVKTLAAAAVLAMSSFATQASTITVGGVTWDPNYDSGFGVEDFSSVADFAQWWSTAPTTGKVITAANLDGATTPGVGELMGIATIRGINGFGSGYVCNTCSLNLVFGGITASLSGFNVANSWFKVYSSPVTVDPFSAGKYVQAQQSVTATPFLTGKFDLFTLTSGNASFGQSLAYLSVTGGLAKENFDTNTQNNGKSLSDLQISGTANFNGKLFAQGSGMAITGNSVVSAPSSLAILGLGLVGLAGLTRRKQAK